MSLVDPVSDPPRGSAVSSFASALGALDAAGGGAAGLPPNPKRRASDVIHQIRKVATPTISAIANAA
jgi:hypothetical protein